MATRSSNPQGVVPGKPVTSRYPTPNLNDRILVAKKDTRLAENKVPPAPGSKYDGPDAQQFKDFVFATAVPTDQVGFANYFYINERKNQDDYNFSVEYPYVDTSFPRYTRTYVLLRKGLEEPVHASPDPVFEDFILTEHRQFRLNANYVRADVVDAADPDQAVLDSLFVGVQRVYEKFPQPALLTRSLGVPNLTPEKYRRQVRTVETNQVVGPDYDFPAGLSGDQVQLRLEQETIVKARLKMIEEIIAIGADPLLGGETSDWGSLSIYETVVNEGEAIDTGYLVLKSTVTAFGNGKAVKITVKYPADLADRTRQGQRWDPRLLAYVPFQERLIPRNTEIGDANKTIEPVDYERSRATEANVGVLPQPIVSFGFRQEQFPIQLVGVTLVGTESKDAVPTFLYPPDIYLARFTRSYSNTPPGEPDPPTQFWAQPFHGVIEYLETTNSTSSGNTTNDSSGSRDGTHSDTRTSTSENTSIGESDGTSEGTSSGTNNTGGSSTHSSSESGTHTGTQTGTNSGTDTNSGTHNSIETGNSATTHSSTGAPLTTSPHDNKTWISQQTQTHSGTGSHTGTSSTTTSGTSSGTSSGSGSHTNNTSSSGTSSNTQTSTHTSSSTETSTGSSSGTSSGTESSSSTGTHNSTTVITRLALVRLNIPPCLRSAISEFNIPATVPQSLPWGQWLTRGLSSELGQYGVWVTDTIEIKFPDLPSGTSSTLFYLWEQILTLTGGDPEFALDQQDMADYAANTVFEVDIDGRGVSQWRLEFWDGVGTPLTDVDGGIIVPPDYDSDTMNYILIRIEGW